ncbi:uncharacterized protein At2g39795, mitochondrial-like [Mercurialis annua]|uniref:uncharacterized protein At2g39795, mitochondrial-like n=1 Tax=Mercurialis annua TaxID=3986 RepID=UPI00215F9646|nr:uncharacterized protein At2g39795, mitochondrial-like [Mercurialis annua]
MAFSSIFRRSALPLARSVRARSRTFHSATSAVVGGVEKQSLGGHHFVVRPHFIIPFSRFSTASSSKPSADASLLGVLQSEIDCAEEPKNADEIIPEGFSFEIQDNPGERTILLERNYKDEIIKVEVDLPSNPDDEAEDDNDDQDKEESTVPVCIPMIVSISKGNGQCLEFGITAYADEITIDTLSIKNPESSEDQLAYEGPDFGDLDENLQKAFHKYLEIRGIKPSTTNFLFDYMRNKDEKEYVQWLVNIKNFVEK